jgi:hypothetical protein
MGIPTSVSVGRGLSVDPPEQAAIPVAVYGMDMVVTATQAGGVAVFVCGRQPVIRGMIAITGVGLVHARFPL